MTLQRWRHHRRPRPLGRVPALGLLVLLVVPLLELGLWEAWHDAPTYDEGIYLASGLDLVTSHQWRLTLEHPPLSRAVAVLPALFAHPLLPRSDAPRRGDEYEWGRQVLAANQRAGKLRLVVFLARLVPLAEAIAVGLVAYAVAATLTDRAGGVLAAGVWLTLPTTLALGHVLSVDVTLALATVVTAWAGVRLLRRPTPWAVAALGAAAGLNVLVRSTSLAVIPGAALVAAAATAGVGRRLVGDAPRAWGREGSPPPPAGPASGRPNSAWWLGADLASARGPAFGAALRRATGRGVTAAVAVTAVAVATLWVGIRVLAPVPAHLPAAEAFAVPFSTPAPVPPAEAALARLSWPHELAVGIRLLGRLSPPAPGYLLGHHWQGIWWAYWPLTVLAKVPVATLVIVAVGLAGWLGVGRGRRRRAAGLLLPLGAANVAPLVLTTRQLGVRLALPVLVLAAVAAAPAARLTRAPVGRIALGILSLVQVVTLATAAGGALAWTEPPLHPGYRWVADSNFDWGQDYYRLASWARGRGAWVAYFGSPGLTESLPAGTRSLLMAAPGSVRGWVAVSASYLDAYRADQLSWLRAYCPVGVLGSTILVYRLTGAPDTRRGPDTPVAPCWGAPASRRA